jgi:hypothetical protein
MCYHAAPAKHPKLLNNSRNIREKKPKSFLTFCTCRIGPGEHFDEKTGGENLVALSLLMRKKTHRILQDLLDGVEESQNVLPSLHGVETGQ